MYPWIRCLCGMPLGDLYDIFVAIKTARYVKILGNQEFDPYMLPITEAATVEMGDVLDAMGLRLDCCRGRMVGQVEFKSCY